MTAKKKYVEDDSNNIGRGFSRIQTQKTNSGETYLTGDVVTPQTAVCIYAQGSSQSFSHTRLDIVWKGRMRTRNFVNTRLTERGIAKAARRFAKEVCV